MRGGTRTVPPKTNAVGKRSEDVSWVALVLGRGVAVLCVVAVLIHTSLVPASKRSPFESLGLASCYLFLVFLDMQVYAVLTRRTLCYDVCESRVPRFFRGYLVVNGLLVLLLGVVGFGYLSHVLLGL